MSSSIYKAISCGFGLAWPITKLGRNSTHFYQEEVWSQSSTSSEVKTFTFPSWTLNLTAQTIQRQKLEKHLGKQTRKKINGKTLLVQRQAGYEAYA